MRTTSKRLIIGAAALAFAAALIFPVFAAAQEAKTAPPARSERPARMLAREALDITPEQEKALGEFRKARTEENKAFREEMTKLRAEIRELAKDPGANQAKIDALIDKTAELRAGREKAAFRNRADRDKIFTPEQLEKMKALRSRFEGRPAAAGRGRMALGRMGLHGPRMGRFMEPGFGPERMARLRALRHRPFLRWRRW